MINLRYPNDRGRNQTVILWIDSGTARLMNGVDICLGEGVISANEISQAQAFLDLKH